MIRMTPPTSPQPSPVVHHVAYSSGGFVGFQLVCDSPWSVASETYHARVVTETNSAGRTMSVMLTRDPVDCMTCLVVRGRR